MRNWKSNVNENQEAFRVVLMKTNKVGLFGWRPAVVKITSCSELLLLPPKV